MATLTEEETIIHERFLQLKAAALTLLEEGGGRLSDQRLVRLGYDCLLDSLDSIYKECSSSASLSKDKYISRFLKKCNKRNIKYYLYLIIWLVNIQNKLCIKYMTTIIDSWFCSSCIYHCCTIPFSCLRMDCTSSTC